MDDQVLDFQTRRIEAHPDKNLRAALEEASQMGNAVQANLITAHCAAECGFNTEALVAEAKAQLQRLIVHMAFVERLSERHDRRVAAARRAADVA